jgi:cell wall-associated NlpC family hydrolase
MTYSQKAWRFGVIAGVTAALLTVSACGQSRPQNESEAELATIQKKGSGMHILKVIPVGSDARISITKLGDKSYIAAQALADVLEYRTSWDIDSLTMKLGVNGTDFELKADAVKAVKADKPVALSLPPIYEKDALYIPVQSLADLFGTDMSFRTTDTEVSVDPTPVKVEKTELSASEPPGVKDELSFQDIPVVKNGKSHRKLVDTAKRYVGIKYKFGTGPFSQTGFFDCSSFIQYLFDKQNIKLPRTARAQATIGSSVDRKKLQPGDLLFFFVPGRFRSNDVIGHVGLYIGDGQMIHSSPVPKDGVQITDINQPYWKKTFIRSVRITGSDAL